MIRETLEVLRSEGVTLSDMAKKLSIQPDVLRGRLELLEEKGYISSEIELPGCSGGCKGCHSRCEDGSDHSPSPIPRSVVYRITDKGKKILQ